MQFGYYRNKHTVGTVHFGKEGGTDFHTAPDMLCSSQFLLMCNLSERYIDRSFGTLPLSDV